MKKWFIHILLLAGLFGTLTTSCSQEDERFEKVLSGKKKEKVTVYFTLALDETSARSRATWGDNLDNDDANNYESAIGDNFDNYINPDQFFVKLNIGNVSYEVSDLVYWQTGTNVYEFVGEVDVTATSLTDAKVMVFANMTPAQTIGDETFNANYSTFPGTGVEYIPMWGVQTIKNLSLAPGVRNDLGTIYLLRSMAKVEVIMANNEFQIEDIDINGYNNQGNCLPNGWNDENTMTTTGLDLEGVFNPYSAYVNDNKPTFMESTTEDGFKCYTVYVPEYDNLTTPSDASTISVTIGDKEYKIEFKNYANGSAYNIVRNHIYRFNITGVNSAVDVELTLKYQVIDWQDIDNGTLNFGDHNGNVN